MSGHTPGPWRAVDGRILPDNYMLLGAPIATVHVRKVDGMQEANARLIAAAPKLLEALQFVMSAHGEQLDSAFADAQAAIAAATGEQS